MDISGNQSEPKVAIGLEKPPSISQNVDLIRRDVGDWASLREANQVMFKVTLRELAIGKETL